MRREKAMVLSGREKSRPGTGSFHPVAIEAALDLPELLHDACRGLPREKRSLGTKKPEIDF